MNDLEPVTRCIGSMIVAEPLDGAAVEGLSRSNEGGGFGSFPAGWGPPEGGA